MQLFRGWPSKLVHQLGLWGVLGTLLLLPAAWALEVPPLTGRVVDRAHILSPASLSDLNSVLAAHESKTSNQVAVLTLPSLEGHPLEDFSHQVATAWALGKKGTDNGVLFLIAVKEKKLRIEVGYGLEGTLTDAKSSQIIRHEVVPRFRKGDFSGGTVAGTQAILGTIEGSYANTNQYRSQKEKTDYLVSFFLATTLGTIVALFLGARWIWSGSVIGSIVSFLIAFPSGFLVGILAAVVTTFLVALFLGLGRHIEYTDPSRHSSWGSTGGHMGGSGGFGGGFGGGFSGGGGGFGGGGASGGW